MNWIQVKGYLLFIRLLDCLHGNLEVALKINQLLFQEKVKNKYQSKTKHGKNKRLSTSLNKAKKRT